MSVDHVISLAASLTLVLLVYSSISLTGVFAVPPDPGWLDSANCTGTPDSASGSTCCWREKVPGQILGERYCQTCKTDFVNGGYKCDQKELQFVQVPPTPTQTPTPTPLGPLSIPEDGVLQLPTPAPTSPLGPRPFTPLGEGSIQEPQTIPTPTPTPEDEQGGDGPGPFTGPLGGGVLQEPEDDEENNDESEDDGDEEQEESSNEDEGSDTAGPLT